MYEISVRKTFSAAHRLKDIGGKCEELHGHNFFVEVALQGNNLNKEGLLLDFRILKEWVETALEELDHKFLNELPYFRELNPSAENIAHFLYERVSDRVKEKEGLKVAYVSVWEGEGASATYRS